MMLLGWGFCRYYGQFCTCRLGFGVVLPGLIEVHVLAFMVCSGSGICIGGPDDVGVSLANSKHCCSCLYSFWQKALTVQYAMGCHGSTMMLDRNLGLLLTLFIASSEGRRGPPAGRPECFGSHRMLCHADPEKGSVLALFTPYLFILFLLTSAWPLGAKTPQSQRGDE